MKKNLIISNLDDGCNDRLLGIIYPLVVTAIGADILSQEGQRSTHPERNGKTVASSLIGQALLGPGLFPFSALRRRNWL